MIDANVTGKMSLEELVLASFQPAAEQAAPNR